MSSSPTSIDLRIQADELTALASELTNTRICTKLDQAALTMRRAAVELDNSDAIPAWVVPVQDMVYMLAVSTIHAGFNVRTMVTPGSRQYNVQNFTLDAYERLAELVKSAGYVVTRTSRQYPYTTRRSTIRKRIRKEQHGQQSDS